MSQRTLILIKPDGVCKGLNETNVITDCNLVVIKSKRLIPSLELARKHYDEHKNKPFYKDITYGLASGEVIAMIVEGEEAVRTTRTIIGTENDSTTLRGKYSNPYIKHENAIHGSDSVESAEREISLWFGQ